MDWEDAMQDSSGANRWRKGRRLGTFHVSAVKGGQGGGSERERLTVPSLHRGLGPVENQSEAVLEPAKFGPMSGKADVSFGRLRSAEKRA